MKNDSLDECIALVTPNEFTTLCHQLRKIWGKDVSFKSVKKIVARAFGFPSETHLILRLKVKPVFQMNLVNHINCEYIDHCRFHHKEIKNFNSDYDLELSTARDKINSCSDVGELICFQLAIRSLPIDDQYVGINSLDRVDEAEYFPSLFRSVAQASGIPSMSVSEVNSNRLINRDELDITGLINFERSVLYYDEANRYLPGSRIESVLGDDGETIDHLMYTSGFASLVIRNTKQNISTLREKMLGKLYALAPKDSRLSESIVVEVIEISSEPNQSQYHLNAQNNCDNSKVSVAIPDYVDSYGADLLKRSGLIISTLVYHEFNKQPAFTTCFGSNETTHNQISLVCSSVRYINDDTPVFLNVMKIEMLSLELSEYGASDAQIKHMHKSILALRQHFITAIFNLNEEYELKQYLSLTRANTIGAKTKPLISDSLSVLILVDRKGICEDQPEFLTNENSTFYQDTNDVDFELAAYQPFTHRLQRAGVVKLSYTYVEGPLGNEINCVVGLDKDDNDLIIFELLHNQASPDYPVESFFSEFMHSISKAGIQVYSASYREECYADIDEIPSASGYYPYLVGVGCKLNE
ncbi:hypothetical protein LRP52_37380 [Photobacterium sp. ZSDE20]|uniref:Uncharacterized protein n=1 Tax=Photobacterium pectinilyticum TaxID=2906793 RepID=A0ABT1N2P4_9GAMM|nr:hypothetical protein [Photobacterium sp. ZSDE20]MCQ1058362.1 hypothetical protein [Photobacterium sp. ZSDE20]MDD1827861.1 hypothetical protein [Photobacterium sp. ZSDE20]